MGNRSSLGGGCGEGECMHEAANGVINLCEDDEDELAIYGIDEPEDSCQQDLERAIAASLEPSVSEDGQDSGKGTTMTADDVEGNVQAGKTRQFRNAAGDNTVSSPKKRRRRNDRGGVGGAAGAAGGAPGVSIPLRLDVVDLTDSPRVQVGPLSTRPLTIEQIRAKLIELGQEPQAAAINAEAAHQRTSTLEAAIAHAMLPCEDSRRKDVITGELVPTQDMFISECKHQHMLSYESFFCKIVSDVRDRCVPGCPLSAGPDGCKHALTQKESEDVIAAVMRNKRLRKQLVDEATFAMLQLKDNQRLTNGQVGWRSQLVSQIYMEKIKTEDGFIECPREGCGWFGWLAGNASQTDGVVCQKCDFHFCIQCKKMAHTNTPCELMLSYARQWTEWLNTGRPRALEGMAKADLKFAAALQAHNARKEQHEADMRNREAQYKQMLADERWKEQNCKRCPHCNFVINKLEGCNEMVCGKDYHGNVVQGGCGRVFHWLNAAKPYIADTGHHPKVVDFAVALPQRAEEITLKLSDGMPLLCSVCSDQIRGPHAVCLHCTNWANGAEGIHQVCIKCQDSSAPTRSGHLPSHICRVFA